MNNRIIENETFPLERALYNLQDAKLINCIFAGAEDGESALKETRNISVNKCTFDLRYPFWHGIDFSIDKSVFNKTSRAGMWYGKKGTISDTDVTSVKFLRECTDIDIKNSSFDSEEFGWKCSDIRMDNCSITSPYAFLDSEDITLNSVKFSGKYSFQYIKNLVITDSILDTKDAFWHTKNATVKDSIIKGEYLAWFSENLTLINCTIIGIQPFCYCKNLKLINCTMEKANDAFEYSDVEADVKGHIDSIKNVRSGKIICDSVGEIINKDQVYECTGKVEIRG